MKLSPVRDSLFKTANIDSATTKACQLGESCALIAVKAMVSPPGKSPRASLAERLHRSRRHRQWANSQLSDSASVGGKSVDSAHSEPTTCSNQQKIRNRVHQTLATAGSSDNISVTSASSTPSPEKRETLTAPEQTC